MKTIKQIFKILFITIILAGSFSLSKAQERKESYEKTFSLKSSGDFNFSCYDTDLKVNTWKKDEVKLMGEIIIEGGDKEDQDKLLEVFKNPKIDQSANSLNIETNMATNTIMIGPFKKTTLINGKTIRIDKYKATYTLWIPENISFNLKSKYNDINIATLTGKANFDLYDVDLTMVSFGKDSKFEMKYSKAAIGKGGDAIMNIYDCELEALEMNNVEITSKYSEIDIAQINTLDFNSYDDEIKIDKINSLTTEAKYSNYRVNSDMVNCFITFYDSDINAKNINKLVYSSKYSSLDASNVNSLNISELYDSDIQLGIVSEFVCNDSKYNEIRFVAISKSINLPQVYSSNIKIGEVKTTFTSFSGDFKYGTISLPLNASIDFNLKYETTYGQVSFPKDRIRIKEMNINDSSKHTFEGQTSDNPSCKIDFKAYDTEINLN